MSNEYTGKVVVITGASAGIGAALARELSRRGAKLVLFARRAEQLEQVAAECKEAIVVVGDATVRADHERAMAAALERFGRVDVWVNNVGRGITRPIGELTDDDVDAMIRDNLKSALYGMQTAQRQFEKRGTGVIANVSSMLGRVPWAPVRAAYSAAKAGVNSLTETLRITIADEFPGIRVMLVLPGVVATEFGVNALGGGFDSRLSPIAQDVEDAAKVIASGLLSGPVDLYTRPDGYERAASHLASLAGRTTDVG